MANQIYRTEIINVATTQAAATTTQTTTAVDMQGYDGVVFLGRFAAAATTNSANVAQATATGGTFADLAGTAQRNVTDFRIDIYRPEERYVRLEYHRASVALGDTWAIQYAGRNLSSSTQTFEFHATPTEGTA